MRCLILARCAVMTGTRKLVLFAFAMSLSACATAARLPVSAGVGRDPLLPAPKEAALPLINVVTARGWSPAGTPRAAAGTKVAPFAKGFNHPRWVYVLPNGDILIAETNAPERPED